MKNSTKCFFKGMGAGMAAGIMLAVLCTMMMPKGNGIKKKVGKTVKAVTDFVDEMQSVIK